MADLADTLSAQLEAALLRELRDRYAYENECRFGNRMKPPVFVLSESRTRLGQWSSRTRTLELSRHLVLAHPWPAVVAVLEHEMAHQYVDEVLGIRDESAHGDTFRRVCAERGIDARAAGAPVVAPNGEGAAPQRVLERIRKLLALAGSSNQHEAEGAMKKAHELMLRHNVETTGDRDYEIRHLGDPARRGTQVEVEIVTLLSEFFFVKVIRVPIYLPALGKRGLAYEIAGTRPNVEMACHVYAFLLATAERLWRENRGDARVRSGRDRLAYQCGVVRGFRSKLRTERVELEGTGLVWVGDSDLERFYRARHPRITTRSSRVRLGSAHAAGHEAGKRVVLHKPVEPGNAGGGRLLS